MALAHKANNIAPVTATIIVIINSLVSIFSVVRVEPPDWFSNNPVLYPTIAVVLYRKCANTGIHILLLQYRK